MHRLMAHIDENPFVLGLRPNGFKILVRQRPERFSGSPEQVAVAIALVEAVQCLTLLILPEVIDPDDLTVVEARRESELELISQPRRSGWRIDQFDIHVWHSHLRPEAWAQAACRQ